MPEWAVHKRNSPSELVIPTIPFVGKHYAEQQTKILVYASAENLSGYWKGNDKHLPGDRLDCDELAQNRHRWCFDNESMQADRRLPFVHLGPLEDGGLPVELSIRNGQLHMQPIREIHSLRKVQLLALPTQDTAEINQKLAQCNGDQLCLEYIAEQHQASVTLCYGAHRREVYYDRTARHLGIRNENGQEIGRWRGEIDNVDIGDEPIAFTCYLDHSMLEIYLNSRKSVTLRNYTEEYRCFRISDNPKSIALWEMASAYQNHEVGSK